MGTVTTLSTTTVTTLPFLVKGVLLGRLKLNPRLSLRLKDTTMDIMETTNLDTMDIIKTVKMDPSLKDSLPTLVLPTLATLVLPTPTAPTTSTTTPSMDTTVIRAIHQMENSRNQMQSLPNFSYQIL